MIDWTEDILNVIGKRREITAVGPRPGKTPTSVPKKTPAKQNRRFAGSRETAKAI
jgi:hypothetical protein